MLSSSKRAAIVGVSCASLVGGVPALPSSATPAGPAVHAVGSDQYPALSTSAAVNSGQFDVVGDASSRLAQAWLDGVRLPDRSLFKAGTERQTQFRVQPGAGRHVFSVRLVNDNGVVGATSTYPFAVSASGARSGRVVSPDGTPLQGIRVSLHNANATGSSWSRQLGVAVTDANGVWTVPSLTLSASDLSIADTNDGVLNIEATVSGTVPTNAKTGASRYTFFGTTSFSTPAASPQSIKRNSLAGESAAQAPIADLRVNSAAAAAVTSQKVVATAPTARGVASSMVSDARDVSFKDSSNNVVATPGAGAADWSRAVGDAPTAAASMSTPAALPADSGGCYYAGQGVRLLVGSSTQYSRVIEGHSASDAKATVRYSSVAGTTFSGGVSYNYGSSWQISGTVYVGSTMGVSTGYTNGPNYSYQWTIPIEWNEYNYWACGLVNGQYVPKTYQGTRTGAGGFKVPSGGAVGKIADNVSSLDGYYGWRDAPYKATVPAAGYFDLTTSNFQKFSASARAFGFLASAETSLTASRTQAISMGTAATTHNIFGYQPIAEGMKVFYAY